MADNCGKNLDFPVQSVYSLLLEKSVGILYSYNLQTLFCVSERINIEIEENCERNIT
jgi:hypothetical protein